MGNFKPILGFTLTFLVLECMSVPGIYLISPPSSGPSPRAENQGNEMEASESLWIGSHKINWSPLPLFLKLTNPSAYEVQKQQAQARKFETKTPIIVSKKSFRSFDFDEPNDRYNRPAYRHAPRRSSKYIQGVGSSFPEFPPRPQLPPPYMQARSIVNHNQQTEPVTFERTVSQQLEVTTPSPIFVSTSASLVVSSQSNNEDNGPTTENLRKMTEWSKRNELIKKEGRPTPVYPFPEKKLRHKKRTHKKKHYKNIADIIMSNDDDEETENPAPSSLSNDNNANNNNNNDRTQIIRPKRLKEENNNRINNDVTSFLGQPNFEDVFRQTYPPPTRANNFVIIHPTNAAFLIKDPLEIQQPSSSRQRQHQFGRKEKRLGLFKKEASSIVSGSSIQSFRFGPEDARVSPYRF